MPTYTFFSHNGELLPTKQATVQLNSIEYAYGFGVYETIRVANGTVFFAAEHCQRLLESAQVIGLEHTYAATFVEQAVHTLLKKNKAETCNVKILLVGGKTAEAADIYIQCLNPLFPDRKLYREGVHCITQQYERVFPHAKTLNMLPSFIAYRKAQGAGAYDALLLDRSGMIIEGTRTNFFVVRDRTITSPPAESILLGVTRDKLLSLAQQQGYEVLEQAIPLSDIGEYDGAFLTSTSCKVLPIRSIDQHTWQVIPESVTELQRAFDGFLAKYSGRT